MKKQLAALVGALAFAGSAHAASFTLNFGASSESSNAQATGASATVQFTAVDEGGDVRLTMVLSNTTGATTFGAGATESVFTGFAFDVIDGVSILSSSLATSFDTLLTNVSFTPFSNRSEIGAFDFGLADNNSFEGGNANMALGAGGTETVSFLLDTDLDALTLLTTYLAAFISGDADAAVRFQQANAGEGSDKLLLSNVTGGGITIDDLNPVPVPGAIVLFGTALAGAAAARRRRA